VFQRRSTPCPHKAIDIPLTSAVNAPVHDLLLLEKHFWDGRKAQVVKLDSDVVARVFTSSGKVYLEHSYADAGEATTTILEWNGDGYPLSNRQRS
jgi:hypothetical protein